MHESSLSPAVHAVLAIELDKMKDGYDFTEYSCRLDLDNYNRNTEQGLHVSASAGAWATMLHGWAGMRIDGEILTFNPKIWKNWNSYTVRFAYQNAIIELNVNKDKARFELIKGKENIALINKNSRLNTTKKPLSITA